MEKGEGKRENFQLIEFAEKLILVVIPAKAGIHKTAPVLDYNLSQNDQIKDFYYFSDVSLK